MLATVAINSFARRHTDVSPYTHFNGTDQQLLQLIADAIKADECETGYRDGVLLASVPAEGFFTGLVVLMPEDKLTGKYSSRQPGESPRQSVYVDRGKQAEKQPAKAVQIILYSHDVLAEDDDAEHDTDYEVISINGYPTEECAPIDPFTLMHNHFKSDGGTATLMSAQQFEQSLKVSFEYWRDKATLMAQPEHDVDDK